MQETSDPLASETRLTLVIETSGEPDREMRSHPIAQTPGHPARENSSRPSGQPAMRIRSRSIEQTSAKRGRRAGRIQEISGPPAGSVVIQQISSLKAKETRA